MEQKAILMKREIRIIANHRALMLSKHTMTLLFSLISFYLGIKRYAPMSLYILIVLNALPPILSYFYRDYSSNNPEKPLVKSLEDTPFQLNMLKEKYKYTKLSYMTNTVSYSISLLLTLFWQINYNRREDLSVILSRIPTILLLIVIFLRFSMIFLYHIKLRYDLSHNKL